MALQVSSPIPHNLGNAVYAPSNRFLVSCVGSRASVLDAVSLETLNVFSCVDKIEKVEVSPDSCYILCALMSRGIVQCFSMADPTWRCRINESVAGIVSVKWCPDSRNIAVESDFGIQMAIWSLVDNTSNIISYPKPGIGPVLSDCGRFMAVGHRIDCKDYIGIYSAGPWVELVKFRCQTNDLASLAWTPSGAYIIATDSHLSYKLLVYTTSGEPVHEYEAYHNALGIRCIASHRHPIRTEPAEGGAAEEPVLLPHPLLAVGSYDGNVRLLSTRSWAVAFVLPACHPSEMPSILNHGISPTVEVAGDADEASNDVFSFSRNSSRLAARSFVPEDKFGNAYVTKPMKSLPHVTADPHGKGGLKLGVHWVGWSGDGQMLAVRAEDYPRCIWIWNGIEGQLASLLVQMSAVTCARWRPSQPDRPHLKPMLAFCTGVARVYFWTPAGTSWVDIPDNSNKADEEVGHKNIIVGAAGSDSTKLLVTHLKWSSDGRKLMLIGKGSLCNCDISSDDIMMGDSA